MERLCLDCNAKIIGRIDKKFCDDSCRSNFYNKQGNKKLSYVRIVNRILIRNRKILEGLNPNGKTKVNIKALQSQGFDFNHFTNIYETNKGSKYHFCYEYGYLLLPFDSVLLVKRKEVN